MTILRQLIGALLAIALAAEPALALAGDAPAPAVAETAPQNPGANTSENPDAGLYQPQDKDERGLWMQMDEAERDLKNSPAVIRDPELNAYVHDVLCRTAGAAECRNVRLYLVRTPYFNASMAPNGAMEVWSGLLLRVENEAQLAAILGHEYTHFKKRHSVLLFRQAKEKSNAATWLAFTGIGALISIGLMGSLYKFSRDMEREADQGGVELMAKAGYDTAEAAVVWERLRAEMDATAAERQTTSRKDKDGGLFGTHPPSRERIENLTAAAKAEPGMPGETGTARFRAAMAKLWPEFVDDQLKMNDFGASDYLLTSLGNDGWSPELLYARGELYRRKGTDESIGSAVGFYSRAIEGGAEIAELWRGRGLAELKLGEDAAGKADLKEYLARNPDAGDAAMMKMLSGG